MAERIRKMIADLEADKTSQFNIYIQGKIDGLTAALALLTPDVEEIT